MYATRHVGIMASSDATANAHYLDACKARLQAEVAAMLREIKTQNKSIKYAQVKQVGTKQPKRIALAPGNKIKNRYDPPVPPPFPH